MSAGTPIRTVRIDDGLWDAAKSKAEAEDHGVSEVIRELLARWLEDATETGHSV